MSDVKMVILNPGESNRLENHLYTGVSKNGVKIFLSSVVFQLKSDTTKGVVIGSDDLEKYVTINKIGGFDGIANLSFDNVPYSVITGGEDIGTKVSVDFVERDDKEPETFSFELAIDSGDGSFQFHFPTINDSLSLLENIIGAVFTFIQFNIKD